MNKFWIGLLVIAAVLIGVRFALYATAPDDKVLIQAALKESIEASKEGKAGSVLDKLSRQFQINEQDPGTNREIADFVRRSKPDVTVENTDPIIEGDMARINSPVRLQMNLLGQSFDVRVEDVTIVFRKEESTKWLIIPTKEWKVYQVHVPEEAAIPFMNLPYRF